MTQATAYARQQDCFATTASLEFFAASLAALAKNNTSPKHVLEEAISVMGVDKERLLSDQAARYGFAERTGDFEETLIAVMHQQFLDLQSCHLTAAQRAQRRLIAAL